MIYKNGRRSDHETNNNTNTFIASAVWLIICLYTKHRNCPTKTGKTQLDAKSDNQEEEYTINAPYEYPIKPGTEEWKLITNRIERAEKCQIPEDILSRITTEALAKTVLEYPFMVDMYAWNTTSVGYQVIKSEFNGLQELEMRPDGLETLQSMSQMSSSDSDGSSLRSRYLDIIISEMKRKDNDMVRFK